VTELPTGPQPWKAELVVERDLARDLIEAQFPELAPAEVEPFGIGWDNTAYMVNDEWVFRFPRRTIAVPWIEQESRVLPRIHERLPLPIPVPAKIGVPEQRYAWPFAGYRVLPGVTACCANLTTAERVRMAAPLGGFLRALHAIPGSEATAYGAGPDTIGRMDVPHRITRSIEAIGKATSQGLIPDPAPYLDVIERVQATRPPTARCLTHGDLYARHLVIGEDRALRGVIDWGDLHVGEPAADLMIAFSLLPPQARGTFREAYGEIGEDTWLRARFRAVYHTAYVISYAHEIAEEDLLREARLGIDWVVQADKAL